MIPLLDTHQHLVYREKASYGWTKDIPPLSENNFTIDDYKKLTDGLGVGGTLFMETGVDDPDYQNFLLPLKQAVIPHLSPNSRGIDFGAGPGPALANMFADDGFEMSLYDLYFHNDRSVLSHSYDFVVTSETVEHFESPGLEFELINNLLKEGGVMGIMTSILYESINIEKWYYRMDPTHIAFYSPETMEWIAKQYNWKLHIPFKNICIFRK